MVRRGGIRTLKEASSGTFHRALRRPYAKVLRLPIPPRARGTEYRRQAYNDSTQWKAACGGSGAKYFPGVLPDYVSLEGYVAGSLLLEGLKRAGRPAGRCKQCGGRWDSACLRQAASPFFDRWFHHS